MKVTEASLRGGPSLDCEGKTVDLVAGSRTVICATEEKVSAGVTTSMQVNLALTYTYEETVETSFSVSGLP
ncbi:MAG: hypothetical protein ABEK12_02740 [Candidatus Nanohaloarchaea archaeon]